MLSETLTSILSKVKSATTEATIASIFENDLYYFIKHYFGKNIIFEKEIGSTDLRHKFVGRMDTISNNLIIEYKRGSKLSRISDQNTATIQVKNYLEQIKSETNAKYYAILTDGQKLRYFYYQNDTIYFTPFRNLELSDLDKLVRTLVSVGNKQFVPENIVRDFKFNAANSYTCLLARCLFSTIENHRTNKTDMLFQEWEVLFRLSENDAGQNSDIEKRRIVLGKIFDTMIEDNIRDYKALFVLQTTYAIIVKLIACKVVSKLAFNNDIMYFSDLTSIDSEKLREFIENLEDGYIFAAGGIRNLLEGDFFSWYCSKDQWNDELAECIMSLIKTLEEYASASFTQGYAAIDIFKDLYMEIMPNEVRHSLGEYFTPSWLANYVVEESTSLIDKHNWRAIDPCCGSGIFIIALIKEIMKGKNIINLDESEKEYLLQEILDRVQGIDINPLSVLTTRVSYLLAIAPLIGDQKFEIPIYLGDSADIPNKIFLGNVECYEYIISTKQGNINVTLPCNFVHNPRFLDKMSLLQSTIKAGNAPLVFNRLIHYINNKYLNEEVENSLCMPSEKLVELHENNWDGIG